MSSKNGLLIFGAVLSLSSSTVLFFKGDFIASVPGIFGSFLVIVTSQSKLED